MQKLSAFHWLVGWLPNRRTLAYGVMEGSLSSIVAVTSIDGRTLVLVRPAGDAQLREVRVVLDALAGRQPPASPANP